MERKGKTQSGKKPAVERKKSRPLERKQKASPKERSRSVTKKSSHHSQPRPSTNSKTTKKTTKRGYVSDSNSSADSDFMDIDTSTADSDTNSSLSRPPSFDSILPEGLAKIKNKLKTGNIEDKINSKQSSKGDARSVKSTKKETQPSKKAKTDVKPAKKTAIAKCATQFDDDEMIGPAPSLQFRPMAPMTKAEWDRQQSVVRRVIDPQTGRSRLIKGTGEVLEEIVSEDRHREINKQATLMDGAAFQNALGLRK